MIHYTNFGQYFSCWNNITYIYQISQLSVTKKMHNIITAHVPIMTKVEGNYTSSTILQPVLGTTKPKKI